MKARKLKWRFYKKRGGPRGIGLRCKGEQYLGCIVCASYDYLDKHGRFPDFETAHAITVEEMRREESERALFVGFDEITPINEEAIRHVREEWL